MLDPRRLNYDHLDRAESIFDDFGGRELLPANEAYRDQARQALDRAVLINLLGLPEDILEPLDILGGSGVPNPPSTVESLPARPDLSPIS